MTPLLYLHLELDAFNQGAIGHWPADQTLALV